jgi:hypothetical protein
MRLPKTFVLLGAAVVLTGCAATKPLTAVGNAALRAGGVNVANGEEERTTTASATDEPHWSSDWVWEGDSN